MSINYLGNVDCSSNGNLECGDHERLIALASLRIAEVSFGKRPIPPPYVGPMLFHFPTRQDMQFPTTQDTKL